MNSSGTYGTRTVTLYKPFYTPGESKKMAVFVEKDGKVIKVRFGDPNMKNRRYNEAARKSFRARHKCNTAHDISTARYWSCAQW